MRPFELYYNENDHDRVPASAIKRLQSIARESDGLSVKHHAAGVLEIRCGSLPGLAELIQFASLAQAETGEGHFRRALTRAIEDWIG